MTMSESARPKSDDRAGFDGPERTRYVTGLVSSGLSDLCKQKLYTASIDRVRKLCSLLKQTFVRKDELIELMAWSAVAQLPMLMLGPWGTGKSLLVRLLARGLGLWEESTRRRIDQEDDELARLKQGQRPGDDRSGRYFEYLVTR